MTNLPFNALPLDQDDSGKRVLVKSIGGPSWPENKWQRALDGVEGTVIYGPCKFWFMAKSKVEGQKVKHGYKPMLKDKKFITEPYWCIRLDDYGLDIHFQKNELTFI